MIRGSDLREPEYPVDRLFLDRWSPRAMSGEEVSEEELMILLEAARWAPSSGNNQPWRILYARRNTQHWQLFFDLLTDSNKVWNTNSAVLLVMISKNTFENGQPARTHSYDTGAAWENIALQGNIKGYVVHGMQGFDYERARTFLNVPDGYTVEAMAAIGKPGKKERLPEHLQTRESPSNRRSLKETAFEGPFRV